MTIPTWPENCNSLAERGSWSFKPKMQTLRSDMDAGHARVRRRFTQATAEIDFNIVMDYEETEYFKSFVEYDLFGGVSWFTMPVFQGNSYYSMDVRFRNAENPYSISELGFNLNQITMQIETRGNALLISDGAGYLIDLWGADNVEDFLNRIHQVVHVDYPSVWDE